MTRQVSLLLVGTLLLTLIAYHRTLTQLTPHLIYRLLADTPLSLKNKPLPIDLDALDELTAIPLLGEMFMEEKVKALVQHRRWSNVLS